MGKYKKTKQLFGIQASTSPVRQAALLTILTLLFFLTVCFSIATAKTIAMCLMILSILGGIACFSTLRQRIHLPFLVLSLIVIMGGISTSYALSGKFALNEALKLISAFCAALILLMITPGESVGSGRRIATILEGSSALVALFSVDLISTRILSTPLLSWLGSKSADYQNLAGVEAGVRMTSIFTYPNIFAGCVGIGVLLSLSLSLSSPGKKERCVHLCCLFVNSVAFLLAFSMGATAAIAIAFIGYLLLEHASRRSDLFVLMAETLVLSAIATAICSAVAFDTWDGFQPIPLMCLVIGAALLCLIDRFVGQTISAKLRNHGKLLLAIVAVLLVLVIAFGLIAYHFTGPVSLGSNDSLRRAAYLDAGSYTLSSVGHDGVLVTVETQNQYDTMMHTSTMLYQGNLSDASFTVPEDSLVVYFNFQTTQPTVLERVEFIGASSSGSIPLNYKLLPNFIANRLQGLFANQNAIQRVVFFQDGMKLFKESPIIGYGLGSFENALHRVQSFFYETKYVHNHYIQSLLETGIIGFILFVGLLTVSAVCILRTRKKDDSHPLTPALGALLLFMAIHAATEVVFSSAPYLPFAYGVFILINLCCGSAISLKWLTKKVKSGVLIALTVLLLFFSFLLGNNISARRTANANPTFNTLYRCISLDKFEWTDYALSYVVGSQRNEVSSDVTMRAAKLAQRLSEVDSNIIPLELTKYYLAQGDLENGFAMAEKYGVYLSASSEAWNSLFATLSGFAQDTAEYQAGVQHIFDLMRDWDNTHIGSIELTHEIKEFLISMNVH